MSEFRSRQAELGPFLRVPLSLHYTHTLRIYGGMREAKYEHSKDFPYPFPHCRPYTPRPMTLHTLRTDLAPLPIGSRRNDLRWAAPFATRLDLDTLEDLVEGAGGFITDRNVFFMTFVSYFLAGTILLRRIFLWLHRIYLYDGVASQ